MPPAWLTTLFPPVRYRPEPGKGHHGPKGYRNLHPFNMPSPLKLLRWRWQVWTGPRVDHRPDMVPRAVMDVAALRGNRSRASATWLGHASQFIQLCGQNILLDPVFADRVSPFTWAGPRREVPLPCKPDDLPRIDLLLITHMHYDHLDFAAVRRLAGQPGGAPRVVVPLGMKLMMEAAGMPSANITELDWWASVQIGDVRVFLTPAHHWSNRAPWGDANKVLWGGFLLVGDGLKLWYPGDTGYHPQLFSDMGEQIGGIDFAFLPIGAYEPRWFLQPQHVNPDESVRIFRHLRVKKAWAIHWGTFILSDEPIQQPMAELAMALREQGVSARDFMVPAIGETRWL